MKHAQKSFMSGFSEAGWLMAGSEVMAMRMRSRLQQSQTRAAMPF
jgi:hypothetical protein